MTQAIKPSIEDITRHLTHLFTRCALESPDTTFQLDRSEVDGPGWGSHQFPTNEKGITNAAQWAVDYNNQGQNLYVGMNPRILGLDPNKSATDADIACAFFSFADFDTLESIDIARDGMPVQNTATVNTGTIPSRRCHLHWEHETAIHNLTAWKQTQIGIANYFHSDKVIDPRRILRLALSICTTNTLAPLLVWHRGKNRLRVGWVYLALTPVPMFNSCLRTLQKARNGTTTSLS